MRTTLALTAALLVVLQMAPSDGLAQKKKPRPKDGVKASPQEYAQILNVKELTGKVAFADEQDISLRVELSHMEPNPAFKPGGLPKGGKGGQNLQRLYEEIVRDQAELARAKNPVERQRKRQELQRDMQRLQMEIAKASKPMPAVKGGNDGPFKLVTEKKDFDLDLADKIVVRWLIPPFQYDDKGEIKKYTKEELVEMKGNDPKLPGYKAKIDELVQGQTVKLMLIPPAKDAKKKLIDEAEGNVPRPTVSMILILEESNLPVPIPKKGKK